MKSLCRIYGILIYAYPSEFRAQFGREMQQAFRDRCRAVAQTRDFGQLLRFLMSSVKDWLTTVFKERFGGLSHNGADTPLHISLGAVLCRPAAIWLTAIFLCLFASSTVVRAYVISAGSMESSLRVGDHVLADRLHSTVGDIQRGDLITFRYPQDARQMFVKRVIGLAGDRIRIVDKQVIRNGRRLVEPYAQHVSSSIDNRRDSVAEAIVPADSFYVLGDNRDISFDSRYWGFVPRENVVGKPWIVFWSYDAPTDELSGWNRKYFADLAQHFFTKTRWERTLLVLHSQPAQEVEP